MYDLICVAMRGRNPEKPTCRESGLKTVQMIEFKKRWKIQLSHNSSKR